MPLSAVEARVLGCLIEKQRTVPDSYPLTLNALRLACNQTSNRHPVEAYDDRTVDAALLSLKSQGLARFVHGSHGSRTTRYRHSADERWKLGEPELAVLSVLVLRGPQTVGELRSRTERQHRFAEPGEVEAVLDELSARTPHPFVVRMERRPGQKDPRWAHLLVGDPPPDPPGTDTPVGYGAVADGSDGVALSDRVSALEDEITGLRRRLAALEQELGVADGPS
ncbi:YceH family protein [soil metagenome]